MSSILKALKKLEEEKVAKRGEPKDIARNILKERHRQIRLPWLPVVAGTVAIAAIAVLITYAAMGGFSRPSTNEMPAAAGTPVSQQQPPQPQPSPALPGPVQKSIVPDPIAVEKATITPGAPKPAVAPVVRQAAATLLPQPSIAPPPPPTQPTQEPMRTAEALSLPSLRITGIAWQKENASRLAIVNGQAVSEGATVGGAKVQTILPDRVEFVYTGQKVTVPLEK